MKHLAVHIQAANAAAAEHPSYVGNVALEGVFDTLRAKFKALTASLGSKADEIKQQLSFNDRAIEEFRTLIVNFKSDISTGKVESNKSVNIAAALAKIGIQADTAKGVIAALKQREAELRKQVSEVGKIAREAPAVIKRGSDADQKEFAQKAKALEGEIKAKAEVKASAKEIVFTKRETLEICDCLIRYCDLYAVARKHENLTGAMDATEKAQQMVPQMEAARDGGVLEGILWIITSLVKAIFWSLVFILLAQMTLFVAVAQPYMFMVGSMILLAMYALRDEEDPRLRERDRNKR